MLNLFLYDSVTQQSACYMYVVSILYLMLAKSKIWQSEDQSRTCRCTCLNWFQNILPKHLATDFHFIAICRPNGGGTCQRSDSENRTQCLSVCEVQGQVPCACGEPYECVVCCQDRNSPGTCSPVTVLNGSLPLSNGAPCSNNRVCIDVSWCDCVLHVLWLTLLIFRVSAQTPLKM